LASDTHVDEATGSSRESGIGPCRDAANRKDAAEPHDAERPLLSSPVTNDRFQSFERDGVFVDSGKSGLSPSKSHQPRLREAPSDARRPVASG
jgi:hypothetical protein